MNGWNIFGGIVIATVLGGLGALIGYADALRPESLDAETLCPLERHPAHTVLLVDRTDALTGRQTAWLVRRIRALKDEISVSERLSVFLIDGENLDDPQAVFSICRPEDGKNASRFTENPRRLKARYESRFVEPLQALAEKLRAPVEAPSTPIFETIRAMVERPEFEEVEGHRRLIVFSDLLAHQARYSHYRSFPDFERFRASRYAEEVWTDLSGFDVELVYLRNPKAAHRQTEKHLEFWRQWFADAGAELREAVRL